VSQKEKATSIRVDLATAERLRLLSDLSGLTIGKLVEEFSKVSELIPKEADKVSVFFLLKKEQLYMTIALMPQVSGSFLTSDKTSDSEVDKRIRKESFQKLGIKED